MPSVPTETPFSSKDPVLVRPLPGTIGLVGYDQFDQLQVGIRSGESTTYYFIRDLRGKTCAICNHGWEATATALADQALWRMLDEYVHESCLERYSGLQERTLFYRALCGVVRFEKMRTIENGYWDKSIKPWYEVYLLDHPARFILGRRKNVDSIELLPMGNGFSDARVLAAAEEFKDENVTKHFNSNSILLHAWSNEKVNDYIKRLATVMGFAIVRET